MKNAKTSPKRRSLMRRSLLAVALGIALSQTALAQETSGSIFGRLAEGSGGTVVAQNIETGLRREVAIESDGRFRLNGLPNGNYRVMLSKDGQTVSERTAMVNAGAGTEVSLAAGAAVAKLDDIVVTAPSVNAIDVSRVESSVTISASDLTNMPIAPNTTAIALLAPGVVAGDSAYSDPPRSNALPSFGGSAVSENSYYINGFPVTNPLTNIGFTELPFNAIDQFQLSTGGYGVEYGRATGGVVNVITQRGSNEWKAGAQMLWRPESLRASPRNIYTGKENGVSPNQPGGAGTIHQYRNDNQFDMTTTSVYASGPIIKDKLFFYAALEYIEQDGGGTNANGVASSTAAVEAARTSGWSDYVNRTPRWLTKLDWNITDDHRVELTGFSDRFKESVDYTGFDYDDFSHNKIKSGGYYRDDNTETWIGNYTGFITDSLTVSAMLGESKTDHVNTPADYKPGCPTILVDAGAEIAGLNYVDCQSVVDPLIPDGANDKTLAGRFDVEYRLGDHTLKAGYDYNDAKSKTGEEAYAGGSLWYYQRSDDPNEPISQPDGVGSPASGGGNGLDGYYVIQYKNYGISNLEVEQKAQYIKDIWQVSDNVLLELGVRNEQFANYNSAGTAYVKKNKQLAPRIGATWDVNGDSSFKVFAQAGRYHLALPNNVAYRGADGIVNTQEAFVYTGVDPLTGAPTGLTSLGPIWSENNEFGQPKDPRGVAAKDLASHFQDAFTFGAERSLGGFNLGAKATYRTLRSAIDDYCDPAPIRAQAIANGIAAAVANEWQLSCTLFNPGVGNTFLQDVDGDGVLEEYKLSADEIGFDKLKRKYYAIDLFLERPFDGKWYGRVDYTYSRNWGNTEGQLQSDYGQDDVSQTVSWDNPELMENANGLLPNHRKHQLKARGYYQLTPEFMLSTSFLYASGRPRNCIGSYPDRTNPNSTYGSYYYYCNGKPSPRGQYGTLPSAYSLDFGVRYSPQSVKGLTVSADIYNLLNRQAAQNINERYNTNSSSTTINPTWGRVRSYSAPRYVQFGIRYDF